MIAPEIIFEDDSFVVIDKPFGVIVNKSASAQSDTIQDWFVQTYGLLEGDSEFLQKGGVVHRLDKDTSGIMVLAKTESAYNSLKQQFLERKTVKKYLALAHGLFKEESGLISAPIERHPGARHKFTIGKDLSRMSITEWKILEKFTNFALLELSPHTGRTHQLRVHLQSINHPILSDPIYGWQKKVDEDLKICPRLFLHAKFLEFTHPTSQKRVSFESALPEVLNDVLVQLRASK